MTVQPAMPYCTACLGKGLLSCELLAISAAAAAGILLDVHKTQNFAEIMQGKAGPALHVQYDSSLVQTTGGTPESAFPTYRKKRGQVERQARKIPKISFTGSVCVSAD